MILLAFIAVTIIFNVALYRANNESVPNKVSSHLESYTVGNKAIQNNIDQVDSQDYIDSLTKEITETHQQDILEKLKQELKTKYEKKYTSELKASIEKEYEPKFKNELRNSINELYSKKYFDEQVRSYQLIENLKTDYIEQHKDVLKDFSIISSFKEVINEIPALDSNFDLQSKIDTKLDEFVNKKKYFSYIIEDLLLANGPKSDKLSDEERGEDLIGRFYRDVVPPYSEEKLRSHIHLKEDKFNDLKSKHENLLRLLKELPPPPSHVAHGNGIMISGGGIYFPGALVTIGQIREMGSKLPIEVIINTQEEYDKDICENLLPNQFNAHCIIIENEIGSDLLKKLNLKKFQMKVLGFLVSRFDNVIALDADSLPLKNVDTLFELDPFLNTKFVLWPDIWHKQVAPQYYEIANIKLGHPIHRDGIANDASYIDYLKQDHYKKVSLHDLEGAPPSMSVESGQLVFSRHFHWRSLILTLYYNIYGPSHYYRLLHLGVPGEGDRETFVPALHALNEPYHVVNHDSWLAGYRRDDGFFKETTIVQADPQQNLKFFNDWKDWLKSKKLDTRLWPFQANAYTQKLLDDFKKEKQIIKSDGKDSAGLITYQMPDVFFLHVHGAKVNPVLDSAQDGYEGVFKHRSLGLPDAYKDSFSKTDWELKFHTISKWIACHGIRSQSFWDNVAKMPQLQVCDKVSKFVDFLKKDSKDLKAGNLKYLVFPDTKK
ncbi:nucleotide-diphospho-sugar transferase [Hyphopichia burtonii NRRL Y-1933]|uniref:Nucleotide-diphospho-sugar transferase n=1 Tax=Hyphopichia burtonii NRRL Y-1933 TaxID=984485 RepID=A0A1E4RP30_9ASCO|nr:nucleotide-diphospho-sugar transferase [Hyphopichia burtonii NRRL Y-1933]ODV69009.1 nucleotide-diphospho-sugar transferase [Hyphopichia burtonii NRRL Y-1933]